MPKLIEMDYALKNLLRHKANFDILEGFLSELLKTAIKIESLLESEGNKETRHDKFNRVDLLVKTSKNEKIIIEVQCEREVDYLSRILYGTSKLITEYMQAGAEYREVSKVISVSIIFFELGQGKDYLYKGSTEFKGVHYHDTLKISDEIKRAYQDKKIDQVSDIFPEYYLIKVNQFRQPIKDKFDEWMYFLKNSEIKRTFKAQGLQKALKKFDVLQMADKDRFAYEDYQKQLHYEASMVFSHYGRGKDDGEALGIQKGEYNKALKIAKKLKAKGMSVAEIIELTGLTKEEITEKL